MVDIVASSSGYLFVTTTGVLKLLRLLPRRVERRSDQHDDFTTKCKFDNVYGRRHPLNDGIVSVTDVIMCRKRPLVCGYIDAGKVCAFALRGSGARLCIAECDTICALQACMVGFQVVSRV